MFLEPWLVLVVDDLVLVLGILAHHLFAALVAFEFELLHKEGSRIAEPDAVQHSTLGVASSTPGVGAAVDILVEEEGNTLEGMVVVAGSTLGVGAAVDTLEEEGSILGVVAVDGTCCFP